MPIIPNDTNSLLVPVQMDAWVVNSSNQQQLAIYESHYEHLSSFESPEPAPFSQSSVNRQKLYGINLHWSLPDALTHGKMPANTQSQNGETVAPDQKINFPFVPNRWLIARFNNDVSGKQLSKLWVIKSDHKGGLVDNIKAPLSGTYTSIDLATGAGISIEVNTPIQIVELQTNYPYQITTAKPVAKGDKQIIINEKVLNMTFPGVIFSGTSNFLDPVTPTQLQTDDVYNTNAVVNNIKIGNSYSIDAWETYSQSASGEADPPFLTAVGAGNVAFAAYQPFVNDVFSFTDKAASLPADGTGNYSYTYMITGWYADATLDPLNAVNNYPSGYLYLSDIWNSSQDTWNQQSQKERFANLLSYFKWSITGDVPAMLPSSTLYHGLVAGVQWPYNGQGSDNPNIPVPANNLQIAIGATASEALAAIIQVQASGTNTTPDVLASLVQSAMYDLLDDYGKPSGQTIVNQKTLEATFGKDAGGIVWNVVPKVAAAAGQGPAPVPISAQQAIAITQGLAKLNTSQRQYDEDLRQLHSIQAGLYQLWLKAGMGDYLTNEGIQPSLPNWSDLLSYIKQTMVPASGETAIPNLYNQVWKKYCDIQAAGASLPNPYANDTNAVSNWASANWPSILLDALNLMLKPGTAPSFWHPNDPTLMIKGLNRGRKFGEDGRYNADGTLTCRLAGQTITGIRISGQPAINATGLNAQTFNPYQFDSYHSIPSVPTLVTEAFFADSSNSSLIATASGIDATAIATAINGLMDGTATGNLWTGTAPAPFSLAAWQQPWIPLYLEWQVSYFPTGSTVNSSWQFSLDGNWVFDGEKYTWTGNGYNAENTATYSGRTIITPPCAIGF